MPKEVPHDVGVLVTETIRNFGSFIIQKIYICLILLLLLFLVITSILIVVLCLIYYLHHTPQEHLARN